MHECSKCGKIFDLKRYLTKHVQRMHSDDKKKEKIEPLKCRICEKVFPRLSHLHRHQLTHLNVREFSCSYCDDKFVQKAHLARHIARKHEEEAKASTSRETPMSVCPKCGNMFKTTYELNIHRKAIHKLSRCDRCKMLFDGAEELKRHSMKCRNLSQICKCCGASFARPADLRSHENSCLKRASFQCIPCGGLFNQRVQLDRHIKKEHFCNEKCSKCGYISDSPVHKASHSIECDEKIICGYCGITNPDEGHVSEKHWIRLKRAVRLEKKQSPKDLPSVSNEEKEVEEVESEERNTEAGQIDLLGFLKNEMDSDPWNEEKSIMEPLLGSDEVGLFESEEMETEEERFLTFEISPDSQAIRFTFRGKVPPDLSRIFPVLEETTIVLLDSLRGNNKMSVQVPVTVRSNMSAADIQILQNYSNTVIKL